MKTQKALLKVILIFMLVILASLLLLFSIPIGHKAFAEDTTKIFVGQDPSKTLEQKSSELKYNNTVGSKAVLTVLLPDLNEDASAWSRSLIKKFSYNENSLLEILKSDSNGDLYTAIYSNYELYITKLSRTHYVNTFDSNADYYERNFSTYSTAHKIITVSFNKVNEVDDRINFSTAYEETEKLINLVLYDLKKTGVAKPTVNIIGHGRGGLLGIKYANNYPTTVNAIYNIGTPHNGSDTLQFLKSLKDDYNVDISGIENLLGGSNIFEYADENSELLTKLKNDWNNNTVVKNPQLANNFYPISGVMDGYHFESIGELTSIFSSINDGANLNDLLNVLSESPQWCEQFIGESEKTIILAFNKIKNKTSIVDAILELNNVELLTILNYFFIYDIFDTTGLSYNKINENENILSNSITRLKEYYREFSTNGQGTFSEYLNNIDVDFFHSLQHNLDISIYQRLNEHFENKMIFGYEINNNILSKRIEPIGRELENAFGIMNVIFNNKDNFIKVSKISNAIGKAMNNIPLVAGIAAGTYLTVVINPFLTALVSVGLVSATVADGINGWPLKNFLDDITLKSKTELSESEIFLFKDKALFMSDLVSEYDSQIASGYVYNGNNHYTKLFGSSEVNLNKSSSLGTPLPFAHYLETMDRDIVHYIRSKIGIKSNDNNCPYFYTINYKDEVTITGVIDDYTLSDNITIPSEIDGLAVKYIGRKAFENKNIKSVTIPNSIISIGDMAFYNCASLTSVTLPSNLENIGEQAFFGCALNGTVQIGASVKKMGAMAFGICDATFNVTAGNINFSAVDGSLYNYEKNNLIKFGGKGSNLNVTLPNTVLEIAPYAFAQNKHIQTISMGNVQTINEFAFAGSSLATIYNANKVEFIETEAFKNTPWLNNNNSDFITLNGILIQYKGLNTSVTIPNNIKTIANFAFAGKDKITNIKLNENINYIGKNVFDGCTDLQNVEFRGQHVPTIAGLLTDGLGHSLDLYVPYLYRSLYINNMPVQYQNSGFKYWCTIKFLDPTNSNFFAMEEFRDTDLPISLAGKTISGIGMNFAGWSESPTQYNTNFKITECKDITVYAFYNYTLTFELDNYGNSVTKKAVYSTTFSFPNIDFEEEGCYFGGWKEVNYGATYSATTTTGVVSRQSNLKFKAQWIHKRYELKVGNNGEYWVYVSGNRQPLLSTTQKWVYYGDEIDIAQLIDLFHLNSIGVIEGKYLTSFSFNAPTDDESSGAHNADGNWDNSFLSIPDLGPNNNSVNVYTESGNESSRIVRRTNAEQRYYLYPIYEDESYYIKLYVDDYVYEDIYNFGDTLPIKNKEHCDFLGWTRNQYGTLSVTTSIPKIDYNTIDIYDFTPGEGRILDYDESLILYGLYREQCVVTFKNDDGTVLKVQYVSLNEDAVPPTDPAKLGYMFDGWDKSYVHITNNLTVTAKYYRKTYTISKGFNGTKIFSDTAAYVDCSNRTQTAVYQIEASVQVITFEKRSGGSGSILLYSNYQRIVVSSRNTILTIILKNFTGQANGNNKAIDASGEDIELYCIGTNSLTGGECTDNSVLGLTSAGVLCSTLTITGEQGARLNILGGNGTNGTAGKSYSDTAGNNMIGMSGTDGTNGSAGGYGIACNNLRIKNINVTVEGGAGGTGGAGGDGQGAGAITYVPSEGVVGSTGNVGGSGGKGGEGGNGGAAIFMLNHKGYLTVESSVTVYLYGGSGGKGGAGGNGGRGGTGGKGGKGKFGVHAAKGGTGGTGGAGGDGGAGGNYGSALATLGVTVDFGNASVTKTNGTGGAGGAGGNGGVGGTGGQGGDKWPTGNLADSGATGSRGANGHKGSDG